MATIHISEAEAATDLSGVLAKVRDGEEVLIEDERQPGVVFRLEMRPDPQVSLSRRLALLPEHSVGVMDSEFGSDVQGALDRFRQPADYDPRA